LTQSGFGEQATQFMESVLARRLSLAVFDCDGTLWSGDAGRDFFYWEIERGLVPLEVAESLRVRYGLYELGEVDELAMCGEMVTMHSGLSVADLYAAAQEFFDEIVACQIFPEMLELTHRLAESGCELWAVSSTNNWVVEVGAACFGIPSERVLAACVHVENGIATDRLHRVPTDELKAVAIREVIGRPIDGVFGNSVHDQAMLQIARYPFCVNPNPDLEQVAIANGWPIYWPAGTPKHVTTPSNTAHSGE
jgi:phosphoserine phosphatase